MNIVYQSDDNYAVYVGVSLTSLFENNKAVDKINVWILDGGIGNTNKDKLCQLALLYGRNINFVDSKECDDKLLRLGAKKYRGSYVNYYKLFMTLLLTKEMLDMADCSHRVLFIDGDTIVTSNLSELFEYDMDDKPVGMVEDTLAYRHKLSLSFKPEEVYFNSGVVLFDLDIMAAGDYESKLLKHINEVRADYIKHEQDIMNVVLKGDICELPLRYNLQSIHAASSVSDMMRVYKDIVRSGRGGQDDDIEAYTKERESGVILHFLRFNGQFAWNTGSTHPYAPVYSKYKEISLWKDEANPISPPGMIYAIERMLYKILPRAMFLRIFRMIHDRHELI